MAIACMRAQMSEDQNKPTVIEEPKHDFSQKDLDIIASYKEGGLLDIATVDDKKLSSMLEMYLSGRTYRQISSVTQVKLEIVLYLSNRFNWFQLRQDYLVDLESSMRGRVIESKIISQDFLLQLLLMWQKKIGHKLNKYFSTDNENIVNEIDLKEIDKYLKTVEMLHKLSGDKSPGSDSRPMIGVNAGDGVTIVKKSDTEIEITPKTRAIEDALKQFADARREEENRPKK